MKKTILALTGLGAALVAIPAHAERTAQEDANIASATAFYEAAINRHDFAAARQYMGDEYIQHNPMAQTGIAGFEAFLGAIHDVPTHSEIRAAFADGDYVILHVHSSLGSSERGSAVMDIFRFDTNGKIVEHWDVIQDIPATAANTNTMF